MTLALASIRPHLAFADGLDLANEAHVRRAVTAYAERNGRTFMDYRFDDEAAVQAILFFPRYCRLSKGRGAGEPFVLAPWQAFDVIAPAFGWKCQDGSRRYRRASIWVPRKNGKTEMAAGIALMHLLCDGEYGGEGYALAVKEDQAKIVFNAARRMVLMNDELRRYVQAFKGSLYCEDLFASFLPLGGKSEGAHGMGPSFRIADELHEYKDDRLVQFIDQGMGARTQPMGWDISTAGLQQGYGWEWWNTCRNLAEGTIVDHRTLVAIYAADEDDDPYDLATWYKANPNLGVSLTLDHMRVEETKARRSPRHYNDFLRYHLNRWVGSVNRWLRPDKWAACTSSADPMAWRDAFDELRGRPCFGGVDLASTRDLCALVWVFPPAGDDDKWRVLARFWLPGFELEERIAAERVPYDNWEHDGAVTITEGDVADHDAIKAQILEDLERYDVQGLGFDPWNAHKLMLEINEHREGAALRVSQNMATMSGPTKLLERLVMTARLDHGNHPVLRWMAANVATIADSNNNIKPAKNKSTQKIDGIVALIIALALTEGDQPATGLPSMEVMTL